MNMDRCHYIKGHKGINVLIPGCMGVAAHYGDLEYCTCDVSPSVQSKMTKEDETAIAKGRGKLHGVWRSLRDVPCLVNHKEGRFIRKLEELMDLIQAIANEDCPNE